VKKIDEPLNIKKLIEYQHEFVLFPTDLNVKNGNIIDEHVKQRHKNSIEYLILISKKRKIDIPISNQNKKN
jgi:hypothetical protein